MVALVLCVRTARFSGTQRKQCPSSEGQWKTLCCECTPHQLLLALRQLWNGGDTPAPAHLQCDPAQLCPFSSLCCRGSWSADLTAGRIQRYKKIPLDNGAVASNSSCFELLSQRYCEGLGILENAEIKHLICFLRTGKRGREVRKLELTTL